MCLARGGVNDLRSKRDFRKRGGHIARRSEAAPTGLSEIVQYLASILGRFGSERPLRSDSHKTHEFLTHSNVFRNTDGKAALHELPDHHC